MVQTQATEGRSRIFISYRREDTEHAVGRLADDLREHFAREQVFQDIASIDPGLDFIEALQQGLDTCAAVLVVIGPRWLSAADPKGRRRLDLPDDWVRHEVAESLKRPGVRVFPVLVGDAKMPSTDELPEPLQPLTRRQAFELTARHWANDVAQLVEFLKRVPGLDRPPHAGVGPAHRGEARVAPSETGAEQRPARIEGSHETPSTADTAGTARSRLASWKLLALLVALVATALAAFLVRRERPAPEPRVAATAPASTSRAPAAAAAPRPEVRVRLGHCAPLTGPQADLGKDSENGARLAVEDLNTKGIEVGGARLKFELLGEDDQAEPKQAVLVAQKLLGAGVSAVIGHLNSGTAISASRIYADAGIAQISPSATHPRFTEQGFKTSFRVIASYTQQGKILGEYAARQLGARTVFVIDDRSAYGQGLADAFEQAAKGAGAHVVAREFIRRETSDFSALLARLKSKAPDLAFYGGMDTQAGPIVKQMQTLGVGTKLLMGEGACTAEFHELAGEASAGHTCSLPGEPLDRLPGGPAFQAKYKARFNADIKMFAPYAYDAVMVVADAIARAGSAEPARILAELPSTDHRGITARIRFDGKGDLRDVVITLYRAQDGKWEALETDRGA